MKHSIARFALLSLLATAATACDDGPVGPERGFAELRIVNAAAFADVQVRRVGATTPLAQDLDFRQFTQACVQVPAGEQALVFSSGGIELATTAAMFEADERYTAFLVSSGAVRRAFVAPDDETASSGNNALRFVNATSAAGDVYVTPPGGAISAAFQAAGNMGPHAMTNQIPSYVHRAIEHTQVRLFNTGTTTGTPRADITLAGIPSDRLATVVFTEAGNPAGPTAFIVTPCQ